MKAKQRMRVTVVADLVTRGIDRAGHIRQAIHIRADLKECRGRVVLVEQF
jgi:hypothetical protein